MGNENLTLKKLVASDGHILTDGENYGRVVYLACGDNGEKWYEITEAEYEAKIEIKIKEEHLDE